MIGGTDVHFETAVGPWAIDRSVRAVLQFWPRAVFEDGNTGDRYSCYADVPFGAVTELFVYRDEEVAHGWDEEGAAPYLEDTMIHLIYSDNALTAVVDDPDSDAMRGLLSVICSCLKL